MCLDLLPVGQRAFFDVFEDTIVETNVKTINAAKVILLLDDFETEEQTEFHCRVIDLICNSEQGLSSNEATKIFLETFYPASQMQNNTRAEFYYEKDLRFLETKGLTPVCWESDEYQKVFLNFLDKLQKILNDLKNDKKKNLKSFIEFYNSFNIMQLSEDDFFIDDPKLSEQKVSQCVKSLFDYYVDTHFEKRHKHLIEVVLKNAQDEKTSKLFFIAGYVNAEIEYHGYFRGYALDLVNELRGSNVKYAILNPGRLSNKNLRNLMDSFFIKK